MKKQNYKILLVLGFLILFSPPLLVNAQEERPCIQGSCPAGQCEISPNKCVLGNPAPGQLVNFTDFGALLRHFITWLLYAAGGIAVLFLIVGGFQYVASRGNEEATEKAKKTITYAVVGIVVIVLAFAIVAIVNTILTTAPAPATGGGSGGSSNPSGGGGGGGVAGSTCTGDSECNTGLLCRRTRTGGCACQNPGGLTVGDCVRTGP